jgi:chaperonin GroEL
MIRKVKTSAKMFLSDQKKLKELIVNTMDRISSIVGSTFGPGGRNCLIESDYPGLPNKNTKDGVTVFKALGSSNSYEHLIIEQTRDAAQRTVSEAGDGTTTATILSAALVKHLFDFCEKNPRNSPQRVAREMNKIIREVLIPEIQARAIKIDESNMELLKMVATVSANGDEDLAEAVIKAFDIIGYGDSSHVTIKTLSGPYGFEVSQIEGFPIPIGFEESIGKFHTAFINDQANQRCHLEKPLFLLFDGQIVDIMSIYSVLDRLGQEYVNGNSDFKNLVIFAHGFSDAVLTQLAFNFANPNTINVVPMRTPMAQFLNSQLHFLNDLAAFTGAKVFTLKDKLNDATPADMGKNMEAFEAYRSRSTIVGDPDPVNIEVRADELKVQMKNSESAAEKIWLEERLGKITNGIAKLTIYGGSQGELREVHDRAEDAICAVRSAITRGALPGGCRIFIDLAIMLMSKKDEFGAVAEHILVPSLMTPIIRLLENAGYTDDEISSTIDSLINNPDKVYDAANHVLGTAEELKLFDSEPAVEESLKNAGSIATVMGTMGGIIAYPRDNDFERSEAAADREFERAVNSPELYVNEANERA